MPRIARYGSADASLTNVTSQNWCYAW